MNANGSIRRMDHGDILLNLFLGTEMEGGPANLYLRRHGTSIEAIPLLGPQSPAAIRMDERGMRANGEWHGIRFCVSLVLAESAPAWFWHVRLENTFHAAGDAGPDLCSGPGPCPLRRGEDQRVLHQPLCGPHALIPFGTGICSRFAPESFHGRSESLDRHRRPGQRRGFRHRCAPVSRSCDPRRPHARGSHRGAALCP